MSEEKKSKQELEKEAIKDYLAGFLNLEKRFPLLPGARSTEYVANFIGLSKQELVDARITLDEQAEQAAQELLKDEDTLQYITRLPFRQGDKLVVIGDSLSDDLQGWFEILRHVLEIGRPDLELEFNNAAVQGDTSFDALRRLNRSVIHAQADWVFVGLGSYDAMRLHPLPERTHVSLTEFWENMNAIEEVIAATTKNPPVWITPPPVITEMMQQVALFDGVVYNEDLSQFREVTAGRKGFVIDPKGVRMGQPAEAWNYLPDGFNPALAGHVATAKSLLKTLYQRKSVKSSDLRYGKEAGFLQQYGFEVKEDDQPGDGED
ncbi:MAG: SGNH/GDSL hydrolase family protein [Cyclonatronaceae bacterium]